jgi:hypothetical protein
MKSLSDDIHAVQATHWESLGHPQQHANALSLFRDTVVRPSLQGIDAEIDAIDRSDDTAADFFRGDIEELFSSTVEGYILTVQSMWERGLRAMLIEREKRLCAGKDVELIQSATWAGGKYPGLQAHFERLIGIPVTVFDSFEDLDLLLDLANAIRHGDGGSAKKVHKKAPSLWFNWLPPGTTYQAGPLTITAPEDGPPHPPFGQITLTQEVLEQMILSVSWFWEDLEYIRCTSFPRKHESTAAKLAAWPQERAARAAARVWAAS